ncbi:MAG: phage tail protein [Clostridia bacterium]|nr:phage tail protein [Clostridia bacterium]
MIECTFFTASGQTLFVRNDAESGHWLPHEYGLTATFPYDAEKVIERGMRIAFRDPETDNLELYEIRQCVNTEPDHAQDITAEHIAVAELQNDHINHTEVTDKTAAQALTVALTGTLWSVGTNTASGTQSADFARGSVWQAVSTIKQNWNVYITPRVVLSASGEITGRYLDISPAQGTWNGVRLSVRKNVLDVSVTYNDEDVYTALYGYGGTNPSAGEDDEITFSDVVWTATGGHPAKPSGQTYLEDPAKTALYGRNGRPRFGYYQNSAITDPEILLQKTWETLKTISEPKISISGTVADLKRLGYNDQPLRLHDLAIVEIEETGELFYKEIIMLDIDLVDPSNTRVDIGDYIPNIVYINRDTANKAYGGGGGGGHGQTNAEIEEGATFSMFEKTNDMIGMVVGTRNGGYYVKSGEIVLAINEDSGTNIKLSADTIDIDGLVSSLSARRLDVGSLHAGGVFATGTVQLFNSYAEWKTITIDGTTITYLGKV